MDFLTKESLIAEIEKTILKIKNRIAVERTVYETRKEIWKGIPSSECTPAHSQAYMRLKFVVEEQFEKIKEEETDIRKIMAFQISVVDAFMQEINVTSPEYNWRYARKYKTPDNPEFSKWLEEFKIDCSERKAEYLIKNANQLSEDNCLTSKQETVVRQSFC